ncbi:uncharacterized protein DS421_18g617280 [Arachis hypogaea]|nr:uncharacterized protein DS421_18g617280 [Arachis hypogaea]
MSSQFHADLTNVLNYENLWHYNIDCGVWVTQWMIRAHLWQDYGVQYVNASTRMRLTVDLIMKFHNQIA